MNALIVYESGFGNTAKIAQAIGEGLTTKLGSTGHVEVRAVADVEAVHMANVDMLVVGSATRGFRAMPVTKALLKGLSAKGLNNVKVAAFDTRFTEEKIRTSGWLLNTMVKLFGYAAKPIAAALVKKGGVLAATPVGFYVDDIEGPLLAGEETRAAEWASQLVSGPVPA